MNWVLEQPLFIAAIGLVTCILLGGHWLQTGRKSLAAALALAVVLTGGLIVVERAVETDREQVEQTLRQIAKDLQRNDLSSLLEHVHPGAATIRDRVETEFPRYTFDRVSIKPNLEIKLSAGEPPGEAVAEFNVVAVVSDSSGLLNSRRLARFVVLTLHRHTDSWKVVEYEHHAPQVGYQRDPQP